MQNSAPGYLLIAAFVVSSIPLAAQRGTTSQAAAQPSAMEFVPIPPGEFVMGCADSDVSCSSDEKPAHRVTITRGFELSKYEVTQYQWRTEMKSRPSQFAGDTNPVEMVSWNDIQSFLAKLNAKKNGYLYRLPTEAEWEYAARAGSRNSYAAHIEEIAWVDRNSAGQTHPAGRKMPNAWGLYDMFGNVFEWVQDWYDDKYYSAAGMIDPAGPNHGERRVIRGGSWLYPPVYTRASVRFFNLPTLQYKDLGFRCAREKLP